MGGAAKVPQSSKSQTPNADWRVVVRDVYAALFDMIGDWAYLYSLYNRDYDGDGESDEYLNVSLNYDLVVMVALGICVLSTIFSLLAVATALGRKCGKNSVCCNCSIPRITLAAMILEDLPQFVLTTYIDTTFSGGLTPAGMLNISSSLNAFVIRATTQYEEIKEEENNDDDGVKATVYEKMT